MDPYAILGVPRGCPRDRVKEAFRSMVQHAHPDHGGDGEAFVLLCAAYRQLLAELDARDEADRTQPREWHEPAPAAPPVRREDYLAWMRQVAKESARRRAAPWWRRHPRQARAALLGLIGLVGCLVFAAALALGMRSTAPVSRREARMRGTPVSRSTPVGYPINRTANSAAPRYSSEAVGRSSRGP